MAEDNSLQVLYFASQLVITALFAILIIFEIGVIKKLGLRSFDTPTLAILASYTMCIGFKMISITIFNAQRGLVTARQYMDGLNMLTDNSVWAMIYFFVFLMLGIAEVFRSTSPSELKFRQKSVRRRMWTVISLSIMLRLCFHAVVISSFIDPTVKDSTAIKALSLSARCLTLALLIYMLEKWLRLLIFFIKMKRAKIEPRRFSCFNKAIIAWVLALTVLQVFNQFALILSGGIELYYNPMPASFVFFFAFELYIVDTILNFSIACSLLYLFYYQGLRKRGASTPDVRLLKKYAKNTELNEKEELLQLESQAQMTRYTQQKGISIQNDLGRSAGSFATGQDASIEYAQPGDAAKYQDYSYDMENSLISSDQTSHVQNFLLEQIVQSSRFN